MTDHNQNEKTLLAEETEQSEDCSQCREYLEGWKRANADYANLQKHMRDERAAVRRDATEDVLAAILPAVDQYDVALRHAPDLEDIPAGARQSLANWMIGIRAVRDIWERAFDALGLSKVREEGPFDPEIHEAVSEEASPENTGVILSVQQSGWKLNDKLIRPARVVISK